MGLRKSNEIELTVGNAYELEVQVFEKGTRKPRDLSIVNNIVYKIGASYDDAPYFVVDSESGYATVVDAQNGVLSIKINPSESDLLMAGRAYHEVTIIEDSGHKTTVLSERVIVRKAFL